MLCAVLNIILRDSVSLVNTVVENTVETVVFFFFG